MLLFIRISCRYCRIYSAADRTVDTDSVPRTSHITGNTFPNIADIPELYLIHPVRICDQAAPHADNVSVASFQDFVCHLWITDISGGYAYFSVTLFYCFCHI